MQTHSHQNLTPKKITIILAHKEGPRKASQHGECECILQIHAFDPLDEVKDLEQFFLFYPQLPLWNEEILNFERPPARRQAILLALPHPLAPQDRSPMRESQLC